MDTRPYERISMFLKTEIYEKSWCERQTNRKNHTHTHIWIELRAKNTLCIFCCCVNWGIKKVQSIHLIETNQNLQMNRTHTRRWIGSIEHSVIKIYAWNMEQPQQCNSILRENDDVQRVECFVFFSLLTIMSYTHSACACRQLYVVQSVDIVHCFLLWFELKWSIKLIGL